MKLVEAHVTKYKSIEDSTVVEIDKNVTVLVGINEAGKSAFLESLYKANSVLGDTEYNEVFDYPRKDWLSYKRRVNKKESSVVAELKYELDDAEVEAIENDLGSDVLTGRIFTETHRIDNTSTLLIPTKEHALVGRLVKEASISDGLKAKLSDAVTISALIDILDDETLTGDDEDFADHIKEKFKVTGGTWSSRIAHYVWREYIRSNVPKFLYFSDYNILPGKINIPNLAAAKENGTNDLGLKTALGLLEMANITTDELQDPESYEAIKAELEAVSLDISSKVFNYWQQNKQLQVEFDVKADPNEEPPFNSGSNLYIRVKNLEHGVSVPFDQRSKGFVWFFSFIVWFNSVQNRIGTNKELTLLLDEPGLSLHGLAQADFLHYIDDLSKEHQILYTTHSPFMIDSEKLHQVRTVEDIKGRGTVVSGNLSSTDKRTLFPLQAGLGYSLAQNLFIGAKNVLVEGPADLIYWRYFSAILEQEGREGLADNKVIVPVGGLDKIATFVSLLTGNELEMAVVHDYAGNADRRLESLIQSKIIKDKQILNYAHFREVDANGKLLASDVEDMISEDLYLHLFSHAFATQLKNKPITPKDLPAGDRIVERIENYLKSKKITLRPSGGYNHYLVASFLVSNPASAKDIDADTLNRFEKMFKKVNKLF